MYSEEFQPPIDHGSLRAKPFIESSDLAQIVDQTGLQLVPDICEEKFLYCFNTLVDRTIREQLRERLVKKTRDQLEKHFEAYRDLSRSLLHSEFPPPVPPADWVKQVEEWLKLSEEGLKKRSSGGASSNVELSFFYPRALGLFNVAFGVTPEATVSWTGSRERGAAFRFLWQTGKIVHEKVRKRGFSTRIPDHLRSRVTWGGVTEDAIGKRIEAALKQGLEGHAYSGKTKPDGTQVLRVFSFSQPAWVYYSDFFRLQLLED